MTIDKAEVQSDLDAGWQEISEVVSSLSDVELNEPGVVEDWSVKDLLGHMAFWADKAAHDLQAITAGRQQDIELAGGQEGVDAWNARESAARRGKSLEDMRSEWKKSYEAARTALEATPEELLEVEIESWNMFHRFAEDTFRHYCEHASQIRAWLRQMETTEA